MTAADRWLRKYGKIGSFLAVWAVASLLPCKQHGSQDPDDFLIEDRFFGG